MAHVEVGHALVRVDEALVALKEIRLAVRGFPSLHHRCRLASLRLLITLQMFVDLCATSIQISLLDFVFFLCQFTRHWFRSEVSVHKVRQQSAEEVLERKFFVTIRVDSPHDGIQVSVTHEAVFFDSARPSHPRPLKVVQHASDLLAGEETCIACIQSLKELCNLQIDVFITASSFRVEPRDLFLYFFHYLDLALKQLSQRTNSIVLALFLGALHVAALLPLLYLHY